MGPDLIRSGPINPLLIFKKYIRFLILKIAQPPLPLKTIRINLRKIIKISLAT